LARTVYERRIFVNSLAIRYGMYILYFLICIYIIKYHTYIPYLFDNTPLEYRVLPCGVTAIFFNIYLF